MAKCQEILRDKKIAGGGKTYKHFDERKIKGGSKEINPQFDQAVYDEYKAYLMGIPETETMILPPAYLLQRNKFLNMRDQKAWLLKQGYVPDNERAPSEQPRSGNGKPTRVYKNWHGD